MLATEAWLWVITSVSAIVMSIGFTVISLTSSSERRAEAFVLLPLYLQPNAPRSAMANIFLGLMGLAFLGFYGSLVILFIIGPWWLALAGGAALFFSKFGFQGWWSRNQNCRPMKPFILWSAALILLLAVAGFDVPGR